MNEPDNVEPIRDYQWETGKRKLVCRFCHSGFAYRLCLDFKKPGRAFWRWQKDAINGRRMTARGKVAREGIDSVAMLAAMLGLPSIALAEIMRELLELQALRNLANLGEEGSTL